MFVLHKIQIKDLTQTEKQTKYHHYILQDDFIAIKKNIFSLMVSIFHVYTTASILTKEFYLFIYKKHGNTSPSKYPMIVYT